MVACGRVRIRSAGLDARTSSDPRRWKINAWRPDGPAFDADELALVVRYSTGGGQFKPRWRIFWISQGSRGQAKFARFGGPGSILSISSGRLGGTRSANLSRARQRARYDWARRGSMGPRIQTLEIVDDRGGEILRGTTPAERLAIADGMWRTARQMIRAILAREHSDWSDAEIESRGAQRMSHGAI